MAARVASEDPDGQGGPVRLTTDVYLQVCRQLASLGHGGDYDWAQSVKAPATPEDLAGEYVWVILNSGMRNTVARKIMDKVMPCLLAGRPVSDVFGHKAKAAAIEETWENREAVYLQFLEMNARGPDDVVDWCEGLPWIGEITKYHLAKNLGVDVAKPDRWLIRLADAEGETVNALCGRLACATGDRIAAVDVVLWRACAVGVLEIVDGAITKGKSWSE